MSSSRRNRSCAAMVAVVCLSLSVRGIATAQTAGPQARVAAAVRNDQLVTLRGNVHPMARAANDRGPLPDQRPVTKIRMLLQRSAAQESALQQLMAQQLDPKSPNYHAWLTPQQFGQQFGPADSDVEAAKSWLTSQGFTGLKVNNGKTLIEFNGTAGAIRNAFHTEVHWVTVRGEDHFANMQEPQIPAALGPVVAGVVGLHNFHPKPLSRHLGKFQRDMKTGQITPLFTYNDVNGTFYGVGPADFATIYNVPNGLTAVAPATKYDGTGQSIAIVGQSNVNLQDIADYRSIFGLPKYNTCPATPCLNVILNGPDPGLVSGDEGESDLDLELSGAVAPNAIIIFVTTQSTNTDGGFGVDGSAIYVVDNNLAPVMSESYGTCESALGTSGNLFYSALWQQAAAEGITVVVSAGDEGPAACDDPTTETFIPADGTSHLGVSGIASTPYNVAMGGTDFDQVGDPTTFWNTCTATNCTTPTLSAKSYIPEITWNDSCAAGGTTTSCANASATTNTNLDIVAGSGGSSGVYARPSWQSNAITGMPTDNHRDLPDVSLFASDGGPLDANGKFLNRSFYILCQSDQDIAGDTGCNLNISNVSPFHDFQATGGTSAAAPTFAAIIALVNQKTGQRQGNANVTLYSLAKSTAFATCNSTTGPANTCVFNDVTKGNISVPCAGGAANCSKSSSGGFGVLTTINGGSILAYGTTLGYDLATGLGSVNVTNLLNKWATPALTSTSVTLGSSPSPITGAVGTAFTLSGTVTSGSGTPSGVVVFENASTGLPAGNDPTINIENNNLTANPAALNASGAYSVSTAFLPAGIYSLKAHYGGDTTHAPSDSAAIAVNLTKQNSAVAVSFVTFDANNNPVLSTSPQPVQYGSAYVLRVDVEKAPGTPCQNATKGVVAFICPTGTVSLLDNTKALNDFPNAQNLNATNVASLNDRGFIEDQPIQLPVGTHVITASYAPAAGSSYNAPNPNTSNTLSVTITLATTTTVVTPNTFSVPAGGGPVTLSAKVNTSSNSALGPTGTVQFFSGSTSLGTAPCTPTAADNVDTPSVAAFCTASLPTTISSLPPGFDFRPGPRNTPYIVLAWLAVMLAMLSFVRSLKAAARKRQYAYAGVVFVLVAAAAIAGCGGGSSSGGGSSRSITAKYSGDTNYATSTSVAATITVQ
jgi:hypothetical protein